MNETRARSGARAAGLIASAILLVVTGLQFASPAATQGTPNNSALVVNSTADQSDAGGADGVCATAAGACTLRAAIQQANYNIGQDTIRFAIPGGGVRRITLINSLPAINDPTGGVTIDGYTQPGASVNTATFGSNAVLRVEIDGPNAASSLIIESAENTVRGLALFGSLANVELRNEAADGNRIVGNFIGTDAAATYQFSGSGDGVLLDLGPDQNLIGTPALADRNVISGNGGRGIRINHGETSQNFIQNNLVGLNPAGTDNLDQNIGIDVQWWSWGNLIGGNGAGEANVLSGNLTGGGVDLSHMATNNLVIGNYIGTTIDGLATATHTENRRGIILKDNPENNYFADNIVAGNDEYGIWHKHNYTGRNVFVNNRIGLGANGEDIGNNAGGMLLRGHDDIYHGNIFANIGNSQTILISNTSERTGHESWPNEQTVRNTLRMGTYHSNQAVPIRFGSLCCPHPDENTPAITGLGPGEIYGNSTGAGSEVEVYISGSLNPDGSLTAGAGSTGLVWLGSVTADSAGRWSMASPALNPGATVSVAATTTGGETSDFSPPTTIPTDGYGIIGNPSAPNPPPVAPTPPPMPPPYVPVVFECSVDAGTLSWDDAGASAYYVFATTAGVESYLGGHPGRSLAVGPADSYRVEHWVLGVATNALCDGPGGGGGTFECSVDAGTLSWDDAGAPEYYVFATSGGVEIYLGGHPGPSLAVGPADSYRVEHWVTGQATNALCDGPGGGGGTFECSIDAGTLSWTDAGASAYYVFATTGGVESYLGGQTGTSLAVSPADSYRVEHWLTGSVTNATCDGAGGVVFSCTVTPGTLTWDDAGAPEYYVFATTGGVESYLGGQTGTSLAVSPADSYRVEHWVTGQATNATCSG